MKRMMFVSVLVLLTALSAFAKQPTVVDAKIDPAVAAPGAKVVITVEFTGKTADVESVEVLVKEYPYDAPEMILQPKEGSEKNVWELVGQVPYEAPLEKLTLEVKALDKDGEQIVTEACKDQYWGKAAKLIFEVKQ